MPKYSVDGNDITPLHIDMWHFDWKEFIREEWDDDQKFIVIFKGGDELIMTAYDIVNCSHVAMEGIEGYIATKMVVEK